jgi:uncharacterized protein YjbI with pentapeptide repeats
MDSEERALRKEELELTRRHNRATVITAAVIAVLSNAVVVGVAVATLRTTATQFELSSRASEYNDIVQGLSSPASAVEINSMRRLQTYIENEDNFPDVEGQQAEATNAVQTLIAYIKENGSSTGEGLADYMSSHPPVVPPAVSRLRQLLSNSSLGENSVDLALVDMHGLRNLQEFSPHGTDSYLPGVDLRGAYLWKVDLTGVHYSSMRRSFLTCADLTDAHMGGTDLTFADLSGADLTGADLGQVRGLTPPSRGRRGTSRDTVGRRCMPAVREGHDGLQARYRLRPGGPLPDGKRGLFSAVAQALRVGSRAAPTPSVDRFRVCG